VARPIAGRTPIIVGGGTNPDNVDQVLPHVDGVIVGLYLKQDGVESAPVDPARAQRYARAVQAAAGVSP
jgi:predicted TIM-barrel enzyme